MANKNSKLFQRAQASIPGGVNSPVRSFKAVGGTPIFIDRAKGAYLYDVAGKEYLDLICSWGAMMLGHGHADMAELLKKSALQGISYGTPTELEVEMAEKIKEMLPFVDLIRMVNSGTEATMSAIRLARGYTDRPKLIKFNGCYHGHSDGLLAQAGSGVLAMSNPSSPGVPPEMVQHTINLEFNDEDSLKKVFKELGKELAAVIIEPIAGNMNLIAAQPRFLKLLRELCTEHGVVLIFDEVMSGFRVARGGAAEIYGIEPDMICLGKIIGGGLPVGAFGGKREIMECLAPLGAVYQAGTLSGNPVVVTAGLHILRQLDKHLYKRIEKTSVAVVENFNKLAQNTGLKISARHFGGMIGIYYGLDLPPNNLPESQQQDLDMFKRIFFGLLEQGVHLPPSHFEACFVSAAHGEEELAKLSVAIDNLIADIKLPPV